MSEDESQDESPASRVSVVVLTCNRLGEVMRTIAGLLALPEKPPVIVVDNGSVDGTAHALRERFPAVRAIESPRNVGASARNLGVAAVRTPYVAFCDDDTCWEPHALARAAALLDAHPRIAVLCARILVGPEGREDPASAGMARSPLASDGLPGRAILGFMAGASVMRVDAFMAVGGYAPQLFIGAEEALVALDLAARGWQMVYCPAIVTRHFPSPKRDRAGRRRLLLRNALWVAWLRLPLRAAWRETVKVWREAARQGIALGVASAALRGLPWVLRRRQVIPPPVRAMYRLVNSAD
ncbi:glycosyltransferase family 2 protein [Pigmentiphaga soli]|uniref:Glycosyltransferase family 2 protein n=1 Tax=Pigmentiphaga soli TaxID=1007095 RepID=A0ABP8GG19_9BURK